MSFTPDNSVVWMEIPVRDVDRGMAFVRHRYAHHHLVDGDRLAALIDYTRFPVPSTHGYRETTTLRVEYIDWCVDG